MTRTQLDSNILLRNAVANDPQQGETNRALQRLIVQGEELCIGF